MPREHFFWGSLSFLIGIGFQSSGYGKLGLFLFFGLFCIIFLLHKKISIYIKKEYWKKLFTFGFFMFLFGIIYTAYDSAVLKKEANVFLKKSEICGVIKSYPKEYEYAREIILSPDDAKKIEVRIMIKKYPEYEFGDNVCVVGVLKKEERPRGRVLVGMIYPEIKKNTWEGTSFREKLFHIRKEIIQTFERILPKQESALLSGIVLGEKDFDKKFQENLKQSGMTHIVALSGYNISVVLYGIMTIVTFFISRKKGLWIALGGVVLFTLMTGGEASIVRAAIMGSIAILAKYKAKRMDVHNAVLGAGACMTLVNPSVLLFDIGFQLSFLALLGLVYITPIVSLLYKNPENSFLGIKENFAQTISAQFAVLPILFYSFGFVSFISIISNIFILSILPVVTFLGFCIAFVSFFSMILAQIIGYITYILLAYQIFIINSFGSLQWNIEYPMGTWGVLLYYCCLGGTLYFIYKKYERKIQKSY